MRVFDIIEEAFKAISTNKIRSGLTVLGIVIGIASVIALTAVGQGSQASITASIESAGANLLTVTPGAQRSANMVRAAFGSAQTLTPDDASTISELDNVAGIAPQVNGRYQIVATSGNTNSQVIATTPGYQTVRNVSVASGSFFSDRQVEDASRVAVLGYQVAIDLFGDPANGGSDPIGQTVRIKSSKFTVIGVAAQKGGTGPENADDAIYVPLSAGQKLLAGQSKYLSSISVQARDQASMTQLQTDITNLLLTRHGINEATSADFSVLNQSDLAASATSTARTLTLLLAAIAGISLVVGGIGIMNMMLTTVTERTREIGLRKAIGAKRRDVSFQFLVEAVVLTFASGILGVLLGWLISLALSRFGGLTSVVTVEWVLLSFGLSAVIGIVFGFYPARRAAGLNPIQSLRYE
ncbi:MAG: ABC transporter permease [Chloroflexi bacterium]|nr:ABC transporter permease [Chloroflexota bacterium]MCL5735659.1 ABC transporter permease [Actinomycetota bacterium]